VTLNICFANGLYWDHLIIIIFVGVDYIIHSASPFHYKVQDPYKDLINPAVKGTTGVLYSALAYAPSVKRVVITSSMAAIRTATPKDPRGLSEADWNESR
jgi:nucleoside-diphosphate-sugar epimerase